MALKPSVGQLIAIGLIVSLSAWMVAGYENNPTKDPTSNPIATTKNHFQVAAFNSRAQPIQRIIRVEGSTKASRKLTLKAEISGKVTELKKQKGDIVSASDVILKLDSGDLPSKLASALAELKQRQIEFDSAQALFKNNYLSDKLLARAKSTLKGTQAQVEHFENQLQHTEIRAPFGGTLEQIHIELGSVISKGEVLGTLLDYHPLLITANLPESEVTNIHLGDRASAQLGNDKSWHGRISYIASASDPITKTFNFEMKIISNEYDLLSGLTATIHVPQPIILAHYISPALLQINPYGKLGVKVVSAENRVEFKPIQLVKSTRQGIWVSGLNINTQIISRGQGFVNDGETVETQLIQPMKIEHDPLLEEFSVGYIKETH